MSAKFTIVLINGSEVVEEADSFAINQGALIFGKKPFLEGMDPKLKIYGPSAYISVEQQPSYETEMVDAIILPEAN